LTITVFSITPPVTGLIALASNIVQITPAGGSAGTYTVTLQISDGVT
jgi:hypothetical protein